MTDYFLDTPVSGPCTLSMRHYESLLGAATRPETLASRLAWVIRRLADKLDGQQSYTFVCKAPSGTLTGDDLVSGLARGVDVACKYINEVHRGRMLTTTD